MSSVQCVFHCGALLHAKTRWEHPLLNALGGRLKSRELICDDCNEKRGRDSDGPLADALVYVRYSLAIRSGEGGPAPVLRRMMTEHGPVDFHPEGHALRSKLGFPQIDAAGSFQVEAWDLESAAERMAHALRAKGITKSEEANRHNFKVSNGAATKTPFKDQTIVRMSIGDRSHARSVAKAAFELFAYERLGDAHDARFDAIRGMLRDGADPSPFVAWTFEPCTLPFSTEEIGECAHAVVVWARRGAAVLAHVTLFGHLRFLVRLADHWDQDDFGLAHVLDPLAGGRNFGVVEMAPPAISLEPFGRSVDMNAFTTTINALRQRCHAAVRDRYLEGLTKRALAPLFERWKQEGELSRDELISEASSRAATAYLEWKTGRSKPIDDEDMRQRVLAALDRLASEDRKRGR